MKGAWRHRLALGLAALLTACSTPMPADPPDIRARRLTQRTPAAEVSAAALGAEESTERFGVDLVDLDIQPVWLSVTNRSDGPLILFPQGIDSDYYPPYEVARRAAQFSEFSTRRLYDALARVQMPNFIGPGETAEGYVFARTDEGMKAFEVVLHGPAGDIDLHFVAPVPGLPTEYLEVAAAVLAVPRTDLDDDGLRRWLEAAPATTETPDGEPGDPVNIVFVGPIDAVRAALISAGWSATAPIEAASVRRMVGAFVFGGGYRYAPISELRLFGRGQDMALQKSRPTIVERNHLRLWLAPVTHRGQPVLIGQISRDVGIKLSGRLWPPTTHVIGPDVDDARFYLLQDLWRDAHLARIAFADGAPVANPASPARNGDGDPYFSDGRRAVFFVRRDKRRGVSPEYLPWTPLAEMRREPGIRLLAEP